MFWENALALRRYHPFLYIPLPPTCPPCTQGHLLRPLLVLASSPSPPPQETECVMLPIGIGSTLTSVAPIRVLLALSVVLVL
jgi:hypothetical protein